MCSVYGSEVGMLVVGSAEVGVVGWQMRFGPWHNSWSSCRHVVEALSGAAHSLFDECLPSPSRVNKQRCLRLQVSGTVEAAPVRALPLRDGHQRCQPLSSIYAAL